MANVGGVLEKYLWRVLRIGSREPSRLASWPSASTVRFVDKVGDVLAMGSAQGAEKQPFKFYV
jgi:hypothetical protein